MLAILSDIQGNLEALQAVLEDAHSRGANTFYCLGDIALGPDPARCVELVEPFDLCLAGADDLRVTGNGGTRNLQGEANFWHDWVESQLTATQLAFLASRPTTHQAEDRTYAHGDPVDNGYLFPECIYNAGKMRNCFTAFDGIFHCGHTHVGGVFTESRFVESQQCLGKFSLNKQSAIINVGSVGQPRDGDPRACYVASYGDAYEFVRVPYDYATTRRKLDELDPPTSGAAVR